MQKSKSEYGTCPVCGLSEEEVRATHKLGCPNCLIFFRNLIRDMLIEKFSALAQPGEEVEKAILETREACSNSPKYLNMLLEDAVEREDYESAIYYRDKIKSLKDK